MSYKHLPSPSLRDAIMIAFAIIISILSTLLLRWDAGIPEFVGFYWEELNPDPRIVGTAMKALWIPVVTLWWLGNSELLARFVVEPDPYQNEYSSRLTWILLAIMVLNLAVDLWQIEIGVVSPVTPGLMLVLVAALLAGKDASIPLGFAALFFYWAWELYHLGELIELFESLETFLILLWRPFEDLDFAVMFACSLLIGTLRDEIGPAILSPYWLFAIGFVGQWLSGWLHTIAFRDGGHIWDMLPGALLTGVLLLMFGVFIQRIQGQIARETLATAEQSRTEAELKALRAQINPHFLFNTLSTIRYHARIKSDVTYDLLEDLSEVFHAALRSQQFIPLSEEFATIESYLALEQARFGDRLQIAWHIAEDVDLMHSVPALALQTFVENGVIHGIGPQPDGGTLTIMTEKMKDHYLIQIVDDGAGFDLENPVTKGHGIGQSNAVKRFQALYGDSFTPIVESEIGLGTKVTVKIPYDIPTS